MKRSSLVRRTPLRPMSKKRRRAEVELAKSKQVVHRRAGGLCEARGFWLDECGWYGTTAHHVLPRSAGGGHEPTNLLWICRQHHHFIHTNPERAYELGLLKKRGDQ